ncbi:HNH endonuclease [Janibacter sp. Y6]|uniref:HNH endonuclease n=1 Tax=Janibacter sp. Y6 TaxID=2913552 RepID=UPI0034A187A7
MAAGRPGIPASMKRDVLIESGYRCAMPQCGAHVVDIEHIEDWAKVKKHEFHNLIALCPNCHRLVTKGDIPKLAVKQIKANLSVLNHRYGEIERRVLQLFADRPGATNITIDVALELAILNLLKDGYLIQITNPPTQHGLSLPNGAAISVGSGPVLYELTKSGREFVDRWVAAKDLP